MKNIILIISALFIIFCSSELYSQDVFGRGRTVEQLVTIDGDAVTDPIPIDCTVNSLFKLSLTSGSVNLELTNLQEGKWVTIIVDNILLGSGEPTFLNVIFPSDDLPLGEGLIGIYSFIKLNGVIYGASRQNYIPD